MVSIVVLALACGPRPGKIADVWGYQDAVSGAAIVPAPTIVARRGDTIVVELEPADLGDDHSLARAAAAQRGGRLELEPARRGARRKFEYRFEAQDVGTIWYHPHVRADLQIEKGLYGALIVRGADEPAVAEDRTFILDDVKLKADGKLAEETDQLDMMLGRQGNVLLVNGQRKAGIEVASGTRERWRFINAANGRYFNLALSGHSFLVIAWDGGCSPSRTGRRTCSLLPASGTRCWSTSIRPRAAG